MWGQRVQEAPEGLLVSPITGHCGGKMVPLELGRGPRADTESAEAWISDPPTAFRSARNNFLWFISHSSLFVVAAQ